MKKGGILAVLSTMLYKPALKQLLAELNISEPVDFRNSVADCLNGVCQPNYLIMELACLTPPVSYTLERVRKKNPRCKIMLFCGERLPEILESFVDESITTSDDEININSKFQSFFSGIVASSTGNSTLSEREKEVIKLVAIGKTNKEISDALFISPHTVITHRKNITTKLGIKTIAGLVVYAVLNGLIDPDQVNR